MTSSEDATLTMLALCLAPDKQIALQTVGMPRPLPGEALIRVLRAGICNTDVEMTKGYSQGAQGMIIGHEFVGKIEEINSGITEIIALPDLKIGDRVVGEINVGCGKCANCARGGFAKRNHCENRTVLGIVQKNGAFAEYITLPLLNLLRVPGAVTDQQAVFVEPLGAAFRITEQVKLVSSDRVCIIGDGKLGLLIAKVLSLQDIRHLMIIGRHPEKMALLPESIEKCDASVAGSYENQFDIGVEACGTMEGMTLAINLVRPLGTIVLKTTCTESIVKFNMAQFVIKEHTIVGSRCGNFKMALAALSGDAPRISVDELVAGVFPLSHAIEGFKMATSHGTLKVQLVMDGTLDPTS